MIANYDKYDYDYSNYWNDRGYEHAAEVRVLKRFLKKSEGNFFIDVGGSFGRHAPLYARKFKTPVIVDYSLKTLQRNREVIQKEYPNVELIAANAYKLPFKDSSIDGAMMVRVLHHINLPEAYIKEVSRILSNGAVYSQEFANKYHIKARVKHLLKGNFSFFNTKPYQQPTAQSFEGSNGEDTVFLNFHPGHIKQLLVNEGFSVKQKAGSSFMRIPFIKKVFPTKLMIFLEAIAQTLLSQTNIAPSVYFNSVLSKKEKKVEAKGINQILICPQCREKLNFDNDRNGAKCKKCLATFEKKKGIWDFRVD